MPLIVETGTGLATADSYVSVDDFKTMCDNWGYDYSAFEDFTIEQALRRGTDFIDTVFRYKGVRLSAAQALEFPRADLTDWSGITVTGVPARVVKACVEVSFKALTGPLYADLDRGGMIASKSVGPMSVSYEAGAPVGKTFTAAEKLLAPYVRKSGDSISGPYFSTTDAPTFTTGMHDNPDTFIDPTG